MLETPPLTRGRPRVPRRSAGRPWKHPRLRGEDVGPIGSRQLDEETPPLTRGRLKQSLASAKHCGNTPAYAGKTNPKGCALRSTWKHPRLRGEDRAQCGRRRSRRKHPRLRGEDMRLPCVCDVVRETPPLTRGRLEVDGVPKLPRGNTPAYAGKTRSSATGLRASRKHPRLRGEDRLRVAHVRRQGGNTPAYAGKTQDAVNFHRKHQKHPRLRGEDRSVALHASAEDGNTPAYAGKTALDILATLLQKETPPLTRGRREDLFQASPNARNTPAYAGKTQAGIFPERTSSKHPRLRGEDCPNRFQSLV